MQRCCPRILDDICADRLCVGLLFGWLSSATWRLHSIAVYILNNKMYRHNLSLHNFSNPNEDQIFQIIDDYIDLNKMLYPQAEQRRLRSKVNAIKPSAVNRALEPIRLSQLITACQQNDTIYNVLQLNNYFDITTIQDYPARYGIDRQLEELIANIKLESEIEILSDDAILGIDKLGNSELKDFQGYKFLDNVNQSYRHNFSIY